MSESESEIKTNEKGLWNVFGQLGKDEVFFNVYKRYPQPVTRKTGLKDLITETETNLAYQFPNAFERFNQRDNPNDPNDRIHLKRITFKAFIRRLANIVLEQIYEQGKYEKSLKEFILDVRAEDEAASSFGTQSSSEEISKVSVHVLSMAEENEKNSVDVNNSGTGSKRESRSSESSKKNFVEQKRFDEEDEENKKLNKNEVLVDKDEKNKEIEEKEAVFSEENLKNLENKNNQERKAIKNQISDDSRKSISNPISESQIKTSVKKPPLPKSTTKSELQKSLTLKTTSPTSPNKSLTIPPNPKLQANSSLVTKKNRSSSSDSSQDPKTSNPILKESFYNIQNKPQKTSDPLASMFLANLSIETSKNSWFSTEIKGKEPEFYSIFSENIKNLPAVFESSLHRLSITPHPHHRKWFKSIQETLHPIKSVQKPKSRFAKPTFPEFVEIMNLWGEKYVKEQTTVTGDLIQTIDHYKNLFLDCKDFSALSKQVQFLVLNLEKLRDAQLESHKDQSTQIEKNKKKFEDIFLFYSKVQRVQGTGDTFEDMELNNKHLTLAAFLKFCSDFNLVNGKGEEKRALSKESLSKVFKKTANNSRLMTQEQFIEALDHIAKILYTPDLDKVFGTSLAFKDMDEKREVFYKQLEIDSFAKYNSKKKAFGIAFCPEKYSRIPVSESSLKYKFRISGESLKKLEEWKKDKSVKESPRPILGPIKETVKQIRGIAKLARDGIKISHPVIVKSMKNLTGYAKLAKMKKNEEKNESLEEKSDAHNEQNEKEPIKITIQALNSLKYHDIDSEFNLNDLITDDSDEYFDKLYGIEPKLQSILKMHDEKLARGQKVIEKSKPRHN